MFRGPFLLGMHPAAASAPAAYLVRNPVFDAPFVEARGNLHAPFPILTDLRGVALTAPRPARGPQGRLDSPGAVILHPQGKCLRDCTLEYG